MLNLWSKVWSSVKSVRFTKTGTTCSVLSSDTLRGMGRAAYAVASKNGSIYCFIASCFTRVGKL